MGFELLTKEELIVLLKERVTEEQEIAATDSVLHKRAQRCFEEYEKSRARATELYDWFVKFCEEHGSSQKISKGTKWFFPPNIYHQNEHKIRELQQAQKEKNDLFDKWMDASKQRNDFLTAARKKELDIWWEHYETLFANFQKGETSDLSDS